MDFSHKAPFGNLKKKFLIFNLAKKQNLLCITCQKIFKVILITFCFV